MKSMKPADANLYTHLREISADPFSTSVNERLLDVVPEELQVAHYSKAVIPAEYWPFFGFNSKVTTLRLEGMPVTFRREIIFAMWRIIEIGGRIPTSALGIMVRELGPTIERLRTSGRPQQSLMSLTLDQWRKELELTYVRRRGRLPTQTTVRTPFSALCRVYKLLWFAYDANPWWQREIWSLTLDQRIPRRGEEPNGQRAIHWHTIEPYWLRSSGMYLVRSLMESGQISWSTAHQYKDSFREFGQYLTQRGITTPRLVANEEDLRPFMMDFLSTIRTLPPRAHGVAGPRRSMTSISHVFTTVRTLYSFMHDFGNEAAKALDEPRWERLGPEYLRFWRPGDLGKTSKPHAGVEHLFSDDELSRIASKAHLLGAPSDQGGLGDPQAMRILLLMIATGRRVSEICMLDANPLTIIETGRAGEEPLAKLHYSQTKIDNAPNTIFVDAEVITTITEQQEWLKRRLAATASDEPAPYLFIRTHNNLRGQRPYIGTIFRSQLNKFVHLAGLADGQGHPISISKTHRFRHTKATKLLNAGMPLHVVQRYLGHTTPEMTMHYAQTLDSTAKAEFLKYQKLTSTASSPVLAAEDLYDLMLLDSHTDRVLPNGWCTLPPSKSCEKGNACLTCDLFVTDERFLDVHKTELVSLESLIETRQDSHRDRTGELMSENHVWLTLRRREQKALNVIIDAIDNSSVTSSKAAGVPARVESDSYPTSADPMAPNHGR